MQTRTLVYAGRAVVLADLPRYARFYDRLTSGTWEPRTFATLARNLDPATTYIDIGAWIGVTPFWAAGLAGRVIAVEPDPACRTILRALAPAHPNLILLEGALSPDPTVTLTAVDSFGSSETSVLPLGGGETTTAPGWSMAAILSHAGPGPIFAKIDVEGYEYRLLSEFTTLLQRDLRGVQLAIHPGLQARTLSGPFRRLRCAAATWRLARHFARHLGAPQIHRHRSLAAYIWSDILRNPAPRGTDLVYQRR